MTYVNGWQSMSERAHEFLSLTPRLTFSPGVGLQGKVWESRRAKWIPDVADDKNFLRKSVAIQSGLHSALAMPILLGEEVLGAMVFLATDIREPDPHLLDLTTNLGSQIGQFIHRKRAEDALRASEEQLAQARAASSVMVTQTDLDGRWLEVTPSLCALLGYSAAELLGRSYEDVTHPADLETNRRQRIRLLSGEIKSFDLEKRYIKKDGGVVWVYLNVSAVNDSSGKPLHYLSYIKDITERKLAEEALRENELKLKLAMGAARIAYWEVELKSGSIVFSNQADRIFGLDSKSLPRDRNSFFALVHPEDLTVLKSTVAKASDSFSSYDTEYRIVRPDGAVRWIASRGQVLPDHEGRPARVIGLSTDITEHKESEEALRVTLMEVQQLRDRIAAENVYLRTEVARTHHRGEVVAQSELMQKVLRLVEQVAKTDVTVLILGETGTGKEVIARALHERSPRADHQLVTVNCSALPAELIESELFGHEKGAFTGAVTRQIGRFEFADGGTIFLDEIGELPLGLQAKLLRVLQEGKFERLGSASTIKVNVRVVAATNRNLTEAVENGTFRADLFYRLNVYPIFVPPLRDRKEDIAPLAATFLREASSKVGKRFERLPAGVVMALEQHYWPGNVRELQNMIERAAVVSASDTLRLPEDWRPIPAVLKARSLPIPEQLSPEETQPPKTSRLQEIERQHVIRVLADTHWKVEGVGGAAEILGLQPNTLRSRMKKLGIPTKKLRAKLKDYEI
jgi:PAS domain S-box-containing protein